MELHDVILALLCANHKRECCWAFVSMDRFRICSSVGCDIRIILFTAVAKFSNVFLLKFMSSKICMQVMIYNPICFPRMYHSVKTKKFK